jgi:hypothetical protein
MKTLLSAHRVDEVKPWIGRDIEGHQTSSVKALIGMLLSNCGETSSYGDEESNIALFDSYRAFILSAWIKKRNSVGESITTGLLD